VETGTFHGDTTRWAASRFEIVHTIERAENLYNLHSEELARIKGVNPHLGDSRDILPQIVEAIHGQKAVFWLDGHWSGGDTAGESDECPLLDELACLSNRAVTMPACSCALLRCPTIRLNGRQFPIFSTFFHIQPGNHSFRLLTM